jgi:isoleucyl-tRNA synthetase
LKLLGLAREAVRLIQEARKSSGLAIGDRIAIEWSATDSETADALRAHAELVASEVLATSFKEGVSGEFSIAENEIGLDLKFGVAR